MEQSYNTQATGPNGYGYAGSDYGLYCMSLAHQIAELRREIGETECGIKEDIHAQSLAHSNEFCNVNKNVTDNAHRNVIETLTNRSVLEGVKCDLDKSILETRSILAEKVDRETDVIKERLNGFERQVAESFCTVRGEIKDSERRILDRLTSDKLDEKNETIDRLRHENRHNDIRFMVQGIGNEVGNLKQMFNSFEQNQYAKSVIKQSGVGNAAIPIMPVTQQ